ncbi:MAG: KOW domain-containing RNA-binding protein [Clostridiales bacterium]|nr:KOW domain-containing RNA-binding protein [Clostridiales bacterium]
MEIEFAKSMSGHDKNHIYLIWEKDEKFVYLVNGTTRTLEKPKKKSRKHIQMIQSIPKEVQDCLQNVRTDVTIKKAIQTYRVIKQED